VNLAIPSESLASEPLDERKANDRMETAETPAPHNLAPDIRASLVAKLERLLARPLIADVVGAPMPVEDAADLAAYEPAPDQPSGLFALALASEEFASKGLDPWREHPTDGTVLVRIAIDYDDLWRGCEKEIRETTANTVESAVTFLTDAQRKLLERSPREFLALEPRPEIAELVSYETEFVGGSERVVALRLAAAPVSRRHVRHLAIVPNLIPLERQLDALTRVEAAVDDGPLGPLRVLIGAASASLLAVEPTSCESDVGFLGERFDEHQRECVRQAMASPHFALIEGPPGSGKTTVITGIIRRALARGERVLVVSPTHVAVDNVVEKLVPAAGSTPDPMDPQSLPVRYAARTPKLSERALEYWVGAKKQRRGATIARRVQARLTATVPFAERLFAIEDTLAPGHAPLSAALAGVESVICGTPIGILSYDAVKNAPAGSFGLLIVDEVSKMTLPEFLAVAVKAKRWVLVGDPAQLPPFNHAEENAVTLDDLVSPVVELACSVGALLERAKPATRRDERLVVVASNPARAVAAIAAHLQAVLPGAVPTVDELGAGEVPGIVVCGREDVERACVALSGEGLFHGGSRRTAPILVERGLVVSRPAVASGQRLVEPRQRAHAAVFETAFNVYHAQPWAIRSGHRLSFLSFRNGLDKCLPSSALLAAACDGAPGDAAEERAVLLGAIARRLATNTVSVFDWLTGMPTADFDTSPLRELAGLSRPTLYDAVRPYVGTLKQQYRMHPSLSRVPRALFYFGRALHDGRAGERPAMRVKLLQVDSEGSDGEFNLREVEAITKIIALARRDDAAKERPSEIMVITPYREQEARLRAALGTTAGVEVCTLDRCQGREADYVFISLVRSSATPFLDMPKRWNVALTRAKQALFLVGNIDAYLREAAAARRDLRSVGFRGKVGETRPSMSLLARIVEAYDEQVRGRADAPGVGR
jgi:hypothetical protein